MGGNQHNPSTRRRLEITIYACVCLCVCVRVCVRLCVCGSAITVNNMVVRVSCYKITYPITWPSVLFDLHFVEVNVYFSTPSTTIRNLSVSNFVRQLSSNSQLFI